MQTFYVVIFGYFRQTSRDNIFHKKKTDFKYLFIQNATLTQKLKLEKINLLLDKEVFIYIFVYLVWDEN